MNKFINLYNTTEYSFLDSIIKVKDLVTLSKQHGLKAVALTDHNNLFGLGVFLELCKENNIKPIIGVDLDVGKYRFILLAKNHEGFKKMNRLIYAKSTNKELIFNDIYDENIFILDHPSEGFYAKTKSNELSKWNNYFVHSSDPNIKNAIFINENKLLVSTENDALNILQDLGNNKKTKHFLNYFNDYKLDEKIIFRINKIVDECNVVFPKKELRLPSFTGSKKGDEELFAKKIQDGLRLHRKELLNYKNEIEERVKEEFTVIKQLGFINYFLIISDLIEFARSKDISIGPGRGSAAGSLISYLLNITSINPLRFGLLFERFLNPKKISWPDIDIDIQDDRRDEVFDYLREKYGRDKTAVISTFQTLGIKQSIRDVSRMLGHDIAVSNRISKSIKTFLNSPTVEDEYKRNFEFQQYMDEYPDIYENAKKIQGMPRQYGIHAAGFIIADKSLTEYVPVFKNGANDEQIQVPMEFVEEFGLLKIDLLGLKTLTEIKNMEKRLKGVKLFDDLVNENALELQDPLAISFLNQGFTEGLFQLESQGMQRTIKQVGIDSFEDLYAIISLYRPGPKDYIPEYARNKKNPKLVKRIHPVYDKIVEQTYGIIIYQEQIMQIAQRIGGLTFGEADLLRRAISKKKEDDLIKYRSAFFEGGLKNGLDKRTLDEIYYKIEKFAQYGFNKSHAVSYAYLTMKMAYYKARYPQIYFSALISNAAGAHAKINTYVDELRNLNFAVYSPSILHFTNTALILDGDIYLPFKIIKGLGPGTINKIREDINENGTYEGLSLAEILMRLWFAGLRTSILELMIEASVFRDFGSQEYIKKANGFIEDEFNQLGKDAPPYKEMKDKLDYKGYESALLNLTRDLDLERDIEKEARNEEKLLGAVYNAFRTLKYEKNYKYRFSHMFKKVGVYVTAAEVTRIRRFRDRDYILVELRDSSLSHTFFVNKNKVKTMPPLKEGDILEVEIQSKKSGIYLNTWKGIN